MEVTLNFVPTVRLGDRDVPAAVLLRELENMISPEGEGILDLEDAPYEGDYASTLTKRDGYALADLWVLNRYEDHIYFLGINFEVFLALLRGLETQTETRNL